MTTTLSESQVHWEMAGSTASQLPRGSFIDDLADLRHAASSTTLAWHFCRVPARHSSQGSFKLTRSSHQYVYDMLCAYRDAPRREGAAAQQATPTTTALFAGELFGIDSALERVIDYFKAAAAGSDVGRRLLLLLGPPSGGKSSLVILLKRGLEEYSHTDDGALYALQGSPLHESPLNLIPASMRPRFRATYGVDIQGELSPYARARLDDEFQGDFMRFPVERIFLVGSGARRRRHVRAARPDDGRHRRLGGLRRSVEGRRHRRRRRPARLVVVGRRLCREPRRARDDRDPQGQARVLVSAA